MRLYEFKLQALVPILFLLKDFIDYMTQSRYMQGKFTAEMKTSF